MIVLHNHKWVGYAYEFMELQAFQLTRTASAKKKDGSCPPTLLLLCHQKMGLLSVWSKCMTKLQWTSIDSAQNLSFTTRIVQFVEFAE